MALADGAEWSEALHAAVQFASSIVALPTGERYRASRPRQRATK